MQAHLAAVEKVESVDLFEPARERLEELVTTLRSPDVLEMTHGAVECIIREGGMEVLRRLLQAHVYLRGRGEVTDGVVVRAADGSARTHRREHERGLMTVFGRVSVPRLGYGAEGQTSLHPLDADLNLPPEVYSHGVQRRVAEVVCKQSFDETVVEVGRTTGAAVPKRQAEALAVRAAEDFEAFYAQRAAATPVEVRHSGLLLVITSDGKGVSMHREDLRPATRKAAEKEAVERDATAATLGEPRRAEHPRDRKRMATVASVYTIAPYGRSVDDVVAELRGLHAVKRQRPRPEQKRVWASLAEPPEVILADAFAEALRRDPRREKNWTSVVDGNETQLAILQELAKRHGIELTIVLDLIHVAEYVWKAAYCFHLRGSAAAEAWVRERLRLILEGRSSWVAAGMRRSATLQGLSRGKREAVDNCADYLLKYRDFLHYDRYLAMGLPIASGVIEGACRHLVQDRMDITGAVWGLESAEAVLKLRSVHASHDFEEYWQYHELRERARNHDVHYANATRPAIQRPVVAASRKRPSPLRLAR